MSDPCGLIAVTTQSQGVLTWIAKRWTWRRSCRKGVR